MPFVLREDRTGLPGGDDATKSLSALDTVAIPQSGKVSKAFLITVAAMSILFLVVYCSISDGEAANKRTTTMVTWVDERKS